MNQTAHTHIDSGPLAHLIVSLGIASILAAVEITGHVNSSLITAAFGAAAVTAVNAIIERRWTQRSIEQDAKIEALRFEVLGMRAELNAGTPRRLLRSEYWEVYADVLTDLSGSR
ncbi:MAG: hypothetical protein JXA67_15195 [Micromonosporaceae bacterium]|nr:hypothetical protein [Micromonosporaceae bacterium]